MTAIILWKFKKMARRSLFLLLLIAGQAYVSPKKMLKLTNIN